MNSYSSTSSSASRASNLGMADWLMSTVKKNPEGLLLLAAGCALMMRSGERFQSSRGQRWQDIAPGSVTGTSAREKEWETPQRISETAERAREYASDLGERVSETAGSYVSAVSEYAEDARRTIVDQSGRIAQQAQSTMERIVQEQPLVVAIAGLAAGAAVAAAFPVTRIERESLGIAGEQLGKAAASAGEQLAQTVSETGERLTNVAEQIGSQQEGERSSERSRSRSGESATGPRSS